MWPQLKDKYKKNKNEYWHIALKTWTLSYLKVGRGSVSKNKTRANQLTNVACIFASFSFSGSKSQ